MRSINQYHFLYRQYRLGYVEFEVYNLYKNRVTNLLRNAKFQHLKSKFNSCQGNNKKPWMTINRVLNRCSPRQNNIALVDNGVAFEGDQEVAILFNEYFTSVAAKLDADIPGPGANPLTFLTHRVMDSFYLSLSTAGEVALLRKALPNKGCNILSIPSFIYKRLVENLSPIISLYFNESNSLGIFQIAVK